MRAPIYEPAAGGGLADNMPLNLNRLQSLVHQKCPTMTRRSRARPVQASEGRAQRPGMAAMEALILVAENAGPTMFARTGADWPKFSPPTGHVYGAIRDRCMSCSGPAQSPTNPNASCFFLVCPP